MTGMNRDARRRLAVSFYAAPPDCSIETFCRVLAARDLGGVGLTIPAVEAMAPADLARLLARHDLVATSLNSAGYMLHEDPAAARQQMEHDKLLFEAAAWVDAPINVIPGGTCHAAHGTPLRQLRARVAEGLAALANRAARAGARLALEVMHPMSIGLRGCINQLSHAHTAIAPHPGFGLTLDLFHSWWDADLGATLSQATDRLSIIQICGIAVPPDGTPPRRSELAQDNGAAADFMRQIAASSYDGLIEYELFYHQIGETDVSALIDRAASDFHGIAAGAPKPVSR